MATRPKIENIVAMIRFCATKLVDLDLRRADEIQRQVRVGVRQLPPQRACHRIGALAAARLCHDGRELGGERPLLDGADRVREEGHVEACLVHARLVERPEHSHRADHADDRSPRTCALRVAVRRGRPEAPPDRALGAEVLLRERGVDDRDGLPRVEVVVGEDAALEELLSGDGEEASRSPARSSRSADRRRSRYCGPRSPSGCSPRRPCGSDS